MKELGLYIVKLLNDNQPVYLPGLGTFRKQRIPSRFDKNTNTFLAPDHEVVFDTNIGSEDKLVILISTKKKITAEESKEHINDFVMQIKSALDQEGGYNIPNLGFIKKEGDQLRFIENLEKDDFLPYKDIEERKLIASSEPKATIAKDHTVETQPTEIVPSSDEEFEPKGRPINWLWPAIIISFMVIAGFLWFFNPNKLEKERMDSMLNQLQEDKANIDTTTTLVTPQEKNEASNIQDSTQSASSNKQRGDKAVVIEDEGNYEIIIVSFGKRSEAEKYVESMNAKGHNVRILENKNPGNLYKVSYRSFKDQTEAQQELNIVRETLSKDAWIYKRK